MDTDLGLEDTDRVIEDIEDREDYCTGWAVMLDEDTEDRAWGVVGS